MVGNRTLRLVVEDERCSGNIGGKLAGEALAMEPPPFGVIELLLCIRAFARLVLFQATRRSNMQHHANPTPPQDGIGQVRSGNVNLESPDSRLSCCSTGPLGYRPIKGLNSYSSRVCTT